MNKRGENMKYVINGIFLTQKITGVQRYGIELLKALDNIEYALDIEVLIPEYENTNIAFKRLKVIKYGKKSKKIWQQYDYMKYLIKNNAIGICLSCPAPLFYNRKCIVVIHDMATCAHPEFYSKKYLLRNKIFMLNGVVKAKKILTVSEFSKLEIEKYLGIDKNKIDVVSNAWQHFEKVEIDEQSGEKFKDIIRQDFYFSLSTLSPNKNLKWVVNVAKCNPSKLFVVAGGKLSMFSNSEEMNEHKNIKYIGYITDSEAKFLMSKCKAYIFPTLYEGFGITPMEALSVGAKIIISDTPCMKEVYEKSAYYVNPYKYNYNLEKILEENVEDAQKILDKYSWEKSAKKLVGILGAL